MSQNFFGTLTAPSLPLLDANFTELYGFAKNLISDASGNVGIGIAPGTASRRLVIYGSTAVATACSLAMQTSTTGTGASDGFTLEVDGAQAYIWNYENAAILLGTNNVERLRVEAAGAVRPGSDNVQTLGSAGFRWSTVYAGTGTINTSDARDKTALTALTASELAAAAEIATEIGSFKFLESVSSKGESKARRHIGTTVQKVMEIMAKHGLDPLTYAFICHDRWPERTVPATREVIASPVLGADGKPILVERIVTPSYTEPAGERYGFRPDQLALFLARGQEQRIRALELAAAAR